MSLHFNNSIAAFMAAVALLGTPGLLAQSALPAIPTAAALPAADSADELSVAVGKSVLIDLSKPIKRVAVGSPAVAEAIVINRFEVMVNGKAAGDTNLILWDAYGNRQFYSVVVHPALNRSDDQLEGIRRELHTELPEANLRVSSDGTNIFLRGTVKDLSSADRAVKIVATAGKVVNLLNVNVPDADTQILLKVRFASIDRSRAKELGMSLLATGALNSYGGIGTGQFSTISNSSSSSSSSSTTGTTGSTSSTNALSFSSILNLFVQNPGNLPISANIQALEKQGVAQVLAEPNIVAANGKQASFLAGGEYPFPMVQGGGSSSSNTSVTIMFKEYGIRLNFIPTITPRGTIRLQVAPEVSALDFADAVTISGFTVPAISSRKVNTEVELASGQTFVLGGLLDNRESETFEKIPFIGDLPVLGKFFQSKSTSRTNTELIVTVTPEIVKPIAPENAPDLNFPTKFLTHDNPGPLGHPDKPPVAQAPAPQTIPVEKLVESMKNEKTLTIESSSRSSGSSSSSSSSGSSVSQ